jgi:NAD(P)-dependent dehydrogenase (short-subunit alcohol dehydrogenase family)
MELKDTWGLILGGSSGLGLESAKKLASNGMNLLIVHRDRRADMDGIQAEFDRIRRNGVEVISFNKDALKADTLQEVIQSLPDHSLRLLLHSLAKGAVKPLISDDKPALTATDLDITLRAMGSSLLDWAQTLIEQGKFSDKGRIIGFTSEGNSRAWPAYGAISAAKGVLEALLRQMALEYARYGITSNIIQAGTTDTPALRQLPSHEKLLTIAKRRNPFGRLTRPKDIANLVYLLCLPEADWINGSLIKADGGESLR